MILPMDPVPDPGHAPTVDSGKSQRTSLRGIEVGCVVFLVSSLSFVGFAVQKIGDLSPVDFRESRAVRILFVRNLATKLFHNECVTI